MTRRRLNVWPPLPLDVYVRRPESGRLPFPLEEAGCRLFSRGRHALWHGTRAIGLRPGDEVLAPGYHHGSEIEALVQAGLVPRFYEATETLEPDEHELDALLSANVRALHLTHYLGFPQDVDRWRRWCDERGLLLLEDAAQAWLATVEGVPVGSRGDVSIFCLYKTFGLPDGGALLVRGQTPARDGGSRLGVGLIVRRHAAWLEGRSASLVALTNRLRASTPPGSEEEFALGDPSVGPSSAVDFLLRRLVKKDAAHARRANYKLLLDELGTHVLQPFRELPDGTSPFAFPLETENKAKVLGHLLEEGIAALDFWSIPHPSFPAERFRAATALRERVIGLPVHQELTTRDVERIADAARRHRVPTRIRNSSTDPTSGPTSRSARALTGDNTTAPTTTPGTSCCSLELEPLLDLDAARDEWNGLADETGNVFATWEWNSIWWQHFGSDRSLLATACRSGGGRLVAVLPLYLWRRRPLRIVRLLGHHAGDELAPICRAGDRGAVAQALLAAVSHYDADIFVGEYLPGVDGWSSLLDARILTRESSPVLHVDSGGWESFLASLSSNLRGQIRGRERKLMREHDVRFRLTTSGAELPNDLDTLFDLHRARWAGQQTTFSTYEAFHRDFAACAFDRGWLRLWFLEVDGEARAAWYGFRFAGAQSFYQSGRDPAWDGRSVGFVVLMHSIRDTLSDGLSEYRFLRGGESYKYRFATSDRKLETIGIAQGVASRTALTAALAARRSRAFKRVISP